jgi:hypothetical protein
MDAKHGSHFSIGNSDKFSGKTTHERTYTEKDMQSCKPDMDFEKRIRSNHFDLGMGNSLPGQYKSVMQSTHDEKGNPMEIRSKLDQERKADLTASHFKVGGDKVIFKSTMQGSYQNMGPSKAAFNDAKKRDLKNSHFVLGDPANADFKSSHDIQYKWVQPKHAKY